MLMVGRVILGEEYASYTSHASHASHLPVELRREEGEDMAPMMLEEDSLCALLVDRLRLRVGNMASLTSTLIMAREGGCGGGREGG